MGSDRSRRQRRTTATLLALCALLTAFAGSAPAGAAPSPDRDDWLWPVDGPRSIVERFQAPADEYGPGHRGVDIAAATGTEVHAPADGVVAFRGTVVDRPLLTIDHGRGLVTTFEPLESTLAPGDAVAAGDVIGTVATGGHASADTLHIGLRLDGVYVDPMRMFGGVARAVLLPCCDPL